MESKSIKVFSYGSNSLKQLTERVGEPVSMPVAGILRDYVRIFAGYSKKWKGGVASVYAEKGGFVEGAVFKLTQQQLDKLDAFEKGYRQISKLIELNNGKRVRCVLYIKENQSYIKPPSKRYIKAIKQTLRDVNYAEQPLVIRALVPVVTEITRV